MLVEAEEEVELLSTPVPLEGVDVADAGSLSVALVAACCAYTL